MHRNERASPAGAGKRRSRVRDGAHGAPQLKEPGERGNPYDAYAVAWTEWPDGKPPRSRVITTGTREKQSAEDFLALFKAERARPPEEKEATVRKICLAYIEAKRGEAHSFNSLQSALQPIIAAWGPLRTDELLPSHISNYQEERLKAPKRRGARGGGVVEVAGTLSRKTIKNELIMFKVACNWAKEEKGWPVTIPPIRKQKKAAKVRKRTLTRAETGRLLAALAAEETPPHLRTFVIVAMLTGQRSGAIRLLKWEHIDFAEGMIWFTRARPDAPDNKNVQDHPITDTLERVLREAYAEALAHRARSGKRGHATTPPLYVIEYRMRPVGSLKTAWAAVLARAKVEGVWVHDLRRTAATYARNAGRSNQEVALFLNDSEKVTERHYAHAAPALLLDMQRSIASIMDETRAAAEANAEDQQS